MRARGRGRKATDMLRVFAFVVALLFVASVVSAGEMEGKIKSWDAATNIVTLQDGTQLSVPADAKVARDRLKEGATVKVSYEEKDGKKIVTTIVEK